MIARAEYGSWLGMQAVRRIDGIVIVYKKEWEEIDEKKAKERKKEIKLIKNLSNKREKCEVNNFVGKTFVSKNKNKGVVVEDRENNYLTKK